MSSDGYDLISIGYEANYLSSQWIMDVNNISSNIYYQDYKTNPYINYKFTNRSELLNDGSGNQKHLINYGGTYVLDSNFDSLLLSSNNYAIIPTDDWNSYKDLTISSWFKTVDAQNTNAFFNDRTNLEVWYKFDNNSTDMLLDVSGKGRPSTNNSATFDSNYRTGNGSVYLNGSSQYIDINSAINPYTIWNSGGGGITFACWFKIPTSSASYSRIFSFGDGTIGSTSANSIFCAKNSTNNTLYFESRISGVSSSFTTTQTYIDNNWHHLVLSISSLGVWILYVDNILINNTSFTNKVVPIGVTWTKRYIGRSEHDAGLYTTGNFDDFRIYNRVLTPAEVDALYRVPQNSLKLLEFGDIFYNDTTNLVAWYKFDGNANDMLADNTGNGYHLVNNGGSIFDNVNYRFGNGSVYMNGSSQYLDMPASINPYTIWNNGNGITFTVWFKMSTASGTFARIFDFGDNAIGTNPSNWIMLSRTGTSTTLRFSIGLNGETIFTTTASYVDNQWHYVVWSISSSGVWSIWIDSILQVLSGTGVTGTLTGTYPKMFPNATWTKRWIGRSSFSTDGYPIGNVDDFRIYNKVLSDFEVNTLFTMGDSMVVKKENNKLSFQVNNTPIYETPYVDNIWNHVVWNITNSSSTQGYVEINNGVKNYFNQITLAPESRQFPPYPMTAFENTLFGYTYRACALSWYTPETLTPWKLFDRSTTRYVDTGSYTAAGVLNITGASFGSDTNYKGVYFGIDMGQPFVMDYYRIVPNASSRRPKYWKIYATNNDACWNATGGTNNTASFNTGPEYGWLQIDVRYDQTQYTDITNFYITKTLPYRYFAFNVNSVNSDIYIDIQSWSIFGYNPTQIIQQYPPVAMTGFSTTIAGITYRACSLNYYTPGTGGQAWKAFDRDIINNRYISQDTTQGTYMYDINGVLMVSGVSFGNDTNYKGIYLGIDMGQPFIMKYYYFNYYLLSRSPRNWKIYATNDSRCWNPTGGTNGTPCYNTDATFGWTQIEVRNQEVSYTTSTRLSMDSNTTPYRYYALHVNALIGGTASGGYLLDLWEWQIFGYPYYSFRNRLGSVQNLGNVYLSDFKIHTTPLIGYDEDKLYGMVDLVNNNGTYTADYTNSIILPPGDIIPLTTTSWNTSNDLTIAGWFKTENIQNGDILFESVQNDIITATNNINNHIIPNNLSTVSFNYTSNIPLSQGSVNISFNTAGAIVVGGITDRSYPLLTTYGTSNTVSPLAIYAGNNINIIEPYMWYKFDQGALTVNDGTAKIDLTAVGTGGTVNTTTFVKGNASVYFANSTANYFRSSTPITQNVPLSIAFWFRIPAGNQNTYTTMVSYAKSPYAAANLAIQFDYMGSTAPANKLRILTALDTQWSTQPTSTTSIAMDTWYHVAYTLDDSNPVNARLYINGILEHTVTGTANKVLPTANIGNFVIGASGDAIRGFIGFIDDFRMYTFALNDSQVSELYKGRAIFYNTRSIRLWRNNNLLEFQNNGTSISTSAITLNNTWNHMIWNVASSANTSGFIRINNGVKTNISEFITNMPLQRFPPASMTAPQILFSSDVYGYNGGTYIISASSELSSIETPWKAFNYDNSTTSNTNYWTTYNGLYSGTSGAYTGSISTIISGVSVLGEWIQIQLPVPIILNNYNIYTTSLDANALLRGPKDFRIAGSNDGVSWTLVDSQSTITSYTASGKSFNIINNTKAYSYYRLVIISNNVNTNGFVSIQEWEFYGFPLYPFKNTLGSITNKGKIWMSDFKILTTSIDTTIENQLYNTTPDDGSSKDTKLIYENIVITSNEIQVYNTDYTPTYPYLQYEFKNAETLVVDSSSNLRILDNDGGIYVNDYGKNSLLLKNGDEAWVDSDDWNKNSNLTISTWFKTDSFKTGDKLLDFYQDPSTFIQIEQYVKYPKEAMTSDTFTSTTTGIVTKTKASSLSFSSSSALFNNVLTDEGANAYASALSTYNTTTQIATTTFFPNYPGEWIMIDLGLNIILKQIRIYPRYPTERNPSIFRIYATNDVAKFNTPNYFDWDIIHDQTVPLVNANYTYMQPTIVNINNNNSYRIYALVVNKITASTVLNFSEWELYGKEVTLTTTPITPVQISGGDYYYAFTNTNIVYNMSVLQDTTCDILVVGGGGGGSGKLGGGGGAGAVLYIRNATLPSASYNIYIGDGGISYSTGGSENGQNTIITGNNITIIAQGGGGTFGGHDTANGKVGGSGGGAAAPNTVLNQGGAAGTGSSLGGFSGTIYGNRGGNITAARVGNPTSGTGGGGAGSAGVDKPTSSGIGNGGDGIMINITNNNYYWGGGGGTAGYAMTGGNGGIGGGGGGTGNTQTYGGGSAWNIGGNGQITSGDAAAIGGNGGANTGGGGGGGSWNGGTGSSGGKGGSGIVIIRFHSGFKIAENSSNQLSLYVNNKSVYDTTNIVDNQWNHIMWNVINNASPYGYIKLNNSQKIMTNTSGTTLTKYPRAAATANTYAYTDGTVIRIGGSTQYDSTETFIAAFNNNTSDAGWGTLANSYNTTSGNALTVYRTDYMGEYLQIDLGEAIVLSSYNIYARSTQLARAPKTFRLYASNDVNCWTNINHISWTLLDNQVNLSAYVANTAKSFSVANTSPYRYYVIIVNQIYASENIAQIAEWELYGYSARTFYTTLNPIIWYQFNDTPDIWNNSPILYDNNMTMLNKFNMTVNSFFNDTTNMLAWYKFDNGNITADYSGNNITLTNGGGMAYNDSFFVRGDGSVYSSALTSTFNLSTTAITINTSFSISFWVRPTDLTANSIRYIISHGTASTTNNLLYIAFNNIVSTTNTLIRFGFTGNDLDTTAIANTNYLNVWTHIAVTFNWAAGGTRNIYVNGVLTATDTSATTPTFGNNFRIGYSALTTNGFIGYIDDIRIYNRVITANEVSILASISTNFFNDTRNMVAWYKFDNNATSMLLDSYGNNNLTNSGGATYDSTNYRIGNGSLYLNGSSQYVDMPATINPYNIWYNNGITFSVWFKMSTSSGAYARIFDLSNGTSGNPANYIIISKNSTVNTLIFEISVSSTKTSHSTTANWVDNQWHHIIWSISATGVWTIYIDGTNLNTSVTRTIPNVTWDRRYIGRSAFSADGWYIGNIDDFRIYNRVLTQDEVIILYNGANFAAVSTVNSTTTNLLAWYTFDNANITADSSGNSRTLTNGGGMQAESAIFVRGNGSVYSSALTSTFNLSTTAITINTSFSISVWVRPTNLTANTLRYIISHGTANTTNNLLFIAFNNIVSTTNTLIRFGFTGNDLDTTAVANTNYLNVWTHIVVTFNWAAGGTRNIYVNGILAATGTSATTPTFGNNFIIGYSALTTNGFIGYIDDVRVYNKVLSANDVNILFRDNNSILAKTTGNTANSYLYQNAYLWNGSTALTTDNTYLSFNGHVSYIQSLLNLLHTTNGFSLHFVFRTSNITSTSQILYIGNSTIDLIRVYVINSTLTFKVGATTQATCTIAANNFYIVDLTTLWSVAKNTMTLKIFVNNANVATVSGTYNNTFLNVNTSGLAYYLGRSSTDTTNDAAPILIQDFRMFHYPLSEPEISALQSGAIAYNNDGLYPGYYINKLGSIANLGDLYLSDFRIITAPMTSNLEDIIYNNKPHYYSIVDEDTIADTIKNMNALYYNGSKKLETNATGVNVKGNLAVTGEILSFYSDERLKTVVSAIDNPVEKIMKINAFKYVPNELARTLGIYNKAPEVGVSAQDVNEILPEIVSLAECDREILDNGQTVSKSGENYLTVSYQRMIPLLIECIKELSDEIDVIEET